MTKATQAESVRSEIIPGAVLTSVVLRGAEIWMNAQGEVLSVMEAAMADWMRRRREAMDTWSRSPKDGRVSKPRRFRSDPTRVAI
jgi:hypothetical protein